MRPELRTRRHDSAVLLIPRDSYWIAPRYCWAIALALALMLAALTAMAMLIPTMLTTLVHAK